MSLTQSQIDIALANAIGNIPVQLQETIRYTEGQYTRPSVLFRPSVVRDGSKWSALYGENLMEGVCGFGDTPEEAMQHFDHNWLRQRASRYMVDPLGSPAPLECETDYCAHPPVKTLKWFPYGPGDFFHLCDECLAKEVAKLEPAKPV